MKKEAINELEQIFKLLGNKQRLTILELLRVRAYRVSEIVDVMQMEQSAISHQLKLLREAQLVQTKKQGREVLYCLTDSHILKLLDNAMQHVNHVLLHESHEVYELSQQSHDSNE
ncbi:winged helix-turn-helix transcriptional regulator [Weissella diestrammenae]|uniref:Winged helix-turn-helix transcriptional regulator n=1 Tax=Weissella diestrammenae TaxID=1162633 RepID=A0A7G9T7F4_9LACO|nr:metalloregulator ArsR/SmtB family transcription factor [Weissella diestrammenae]MCM0582085.1 winged helix-turn-helix transcriptional regulator [Weissella diestrammenae]QNN76029.1 winged helix-turn-helix transcriptional regulator [Weissella diestrammenae]